MTTNIARENHLHLSMLSQDVSHDMLSLFNNFVPKLGDSLRAAWQELARYDARERTIDNSRRFMQIVEPLNYLDMSQFVIASPERLQCDYLTYTNALVQAVQFVMQTQSITLVNLRTHLARLLNSNTISYSPSGQERVVMDRLKLREQIAKDIQSCLGYDGSRKMAYGQAIKRNQDWQAVFDNVKQLEMLSKGARDDMVKELEDIYAILDAVIAKVNDPEQSRGINRAAVKYTGDLVFAAGEEVKFVAQTYYLVEALLTRLDEATKQVIKVFG